MMAMSIDTTTQHHISTDIDLDMMSENGDKHDEIDFDIDIEFDAPDTNQDVEVQDAPLDTEHHDAVHYTDEIMYEEGDGTFGEGHVEEFEMQEEQHDADQQMDETIYHEAHSELNLEMFGEGRSQFDNESHSLLDEVAVVEHPQELTTSTISPAEVPGTFDSLATSKYATISAPTQDLDPTRTISATPIQATEVDALVTENAATGPTSDANEDKLTTDTLLPAQSIAVSTTDAELTTVSNPEESTPDVEKDEIDFDSDIEEEESAENFQDIPGSQVVETTTAGTGLHSNEEANSNHNSTEDTEHLTGHVLPEQATTSNENHTETHEHYKTEEFGSFAYNAIVQYGDHSMALFPPDTHSEDLPETFLLQDGNLAESPLPNLFEACRATLADSINLDDTLCIEVTGLKISLSEVRAHYDSLHGCD
jgi:hypothetical protein